MDEPSWTKLADGSYTRPVLGSEAAVDMVSVMTNGYGDVCIGVSFSTRMSETALTERARDGLVRLRYQSPLAAATLVQNSDSILRQWNYQVAGTYADAQEWASHALKVHANGPPANEFIKTVTANPLPYVSGQRSLFLVCHLVLRDSGTHSLIFHGVHAIMDTKPTLAVLADLLGWITTPPETPTASLNWGDEWKNLPEGPVTSTGGPKEGYASEVPRLISRMEEMERNPTASKGILPQRDAIRQQGKAVHASHDMDKSQTARLIENVRGLGLTVTTLFEAAQVLATFARNEITDDEEAQVTLDVTVVAHQKHFVPPHNTAAHFVSSMTMTPVIVYYKDIKHLDAKAQMLAIMRTLKAQYGEWTASPHLPMLGHRLFQPVAPSPYAGVITNVGIIEDILPLKWPDAELCEFVLGLRDSAITRPCTHVWTFDGKFHVQAQAADVFDQEYLQAYVDDIVKNALRFL